MLWDVEILFLDLKCQLVGRGEHYRPQLNIFPLDLSLNVEIDQKHVHTFKTSVNKKRKAC